MKEWRKLETITVSEDAIKEKEITVDFEEVYILCTGLENVGTVNSALKMLINNQQVGKGFDTLKSGTESKKQQEAHYKYNGLFWEGFLQNACNGGTAYYTNSGSPYSPYLSNKEIGVGRTLTFTTLSQYALSNGTIEIWVR